MKSIVFQMHFEKYNIVGVASDIVEFDLIGLECLDDKSIQVGE